MPAAAAGLALSLALSLLAYLRSRQPVSTYYESEYYGMTGASHKRFAAAFLAFAGVFAASLAVHAIPVTLVFGGYVLVMIFYASSFVRGYGE